MDAKQNELKVETAAENQLSFEEALRRLEQVVRQLETGELSLDKSLEAFREGTELARYCRRKLDEVESSITQLVSSPDGELIEEDFPELDHE